MMCRSMYLEGRGAVQRGREKRCKGRRKNGRVKQGGGRNSWKNKGIELSPLQRLPWRGGAQKERGERSRAGDDRKREKVGASFASFLPSVPPALVFSLSPVSARVIFPSPQSFLSPISQEASAEKRGNGEKQRHQEEKTEKTNRHFIYTQKLRRREKKEFTKYYKGDGIFQCLLLSPPLKTSCKGAVRMQRSIFLPASSSRYEKQIIKRLSYLSTCTKLSLHHRFFPHILAHQQI